VVYPVLEFTEEKHTFAKIKRGNVNFFLFHGMFKRAIAALDPRKTVSDSLF
jgi:hypothetical protein